MNLITDSWITVINKQGKIQHISPCEIVHLDFIDIYAARPDFKGALYQFLIGLLQAAYSPRI